MIIIILFFERKRKRREEEEEEEEEKNERTNENKSIYKYKRNIFSNDFFLFANKMSIRRRRREKKTLNISLAFFLYLKLIRQSSK